MKSLCNATEDKMNSRELVIYLSIYLILGLCSDCVKPSMVIFNTRISKNATEDRLNSRKLVIYLYIFDLGLCEVNLSSRP